MSSGSSNNKKPPPKFMGETDLLIAALLANEAAKRTQEYNKLGVGAYLSNTGPSTSKLKPNTRFLETIIKQTDHHNKSVLEDQARSAQEKLVEIDRSVDFDSSSSAEGRSGQRRTRDVERGRVMKAPRLPEENTQIQVDKFALFRDRPCSFSSFNVPANIHTSGSGEDGTATKAATLTGDTKTSKMEYPLSEDWEDVMDYLEDYLEDKRSSRKSHRRGRSIERKNKRKRSRSRSSSSKCKRKSRKKRSSSTLSTSSTSSTSSRESKRRKKRKDKEKHRSKHKRDEKRSEKHDHKKKRKPDSEKEDFDDGRRSKVSRDEEHDSGRWKHDKYYEQAINEDVSRDVDTSKSKWKHDKYYEQAINEDISRDVDTSKSRWKHDKYYEQAINEDVSRDVDTSKSRWKHDKYYEEYNSKNGTYPAYNERLHDVVSKSHIVSHSTVHHSEHDDRSVSSSNDSSDGDNGSSFRNMNDPKSFIKHTQLSDYTTKRLTTTIFSNRDTLQRSRFVDFQFDGDDPFREDKTTIKPVQFKLGYDPCKELPDYTSDAFTDEDKEFCPQSGFMMSVDRRNIQTERLGDTRPTHTSDESEDLEEPTEHRGLLEEGELQDAILRYEEVDDSVHEDNMKLKDTIRKDAKHESTRSDERKSSSSRRTREDGVYRKQRTEDNDHRNDSMMEKWREEKRDRYRETHRHSHCHERSHKDDHGRSSRSGKSEHEESRRIKSHDSSSRSGRSSLGDRSRPRDSSRSRHRRRDLDERYESRSHRSREKDDRERVAHRSDTARVSPTSKAKKRAGNGNRDESQSPNRSRVHDFEHDRYRPGNYDSGKDNYKDLNKVWKHDKFDGF